MFKSFVTAIVSAVRTNNRDLLDDLLPSDCFMSGVVLSGGFGSALRNADSFHQFAVVQLALLTGRDVRGFAHHGFPTNQTPEQHTAGLTVTATDPSVIFVIHAHAGVVTHVEPSRVVPVPYNYQGVDEGLATYKGPVFVGSLQECRTWLERYTYSDKA